MVSSMSTGAGAVLSIESKCVHRNLRNTLQFFLRGKLGDLGLRIGRLFCEIEKVRNSFKRIIDFVRDG